MIWAMYAKLGNNMWTYRNRKDVLVFNEEGWTKLKKDAKERGFNTIFLDIGEGIEWHCRPELSVPGAWSHERIKKEVLELREMGIELCPKLNFSACHHLWLGEYRKMMSTPVYYDVVRETITEAYEAFLKPSKFHLGMDEEGSQTQILMYDGYINFRRDEAFWTDFNYIIKCAVDLGTQPWVWWDAFKSYPELYPEKAQYKEETVLIPWWYAALKPHHFTLLEDSPGYVGIKERFPLHYGHKTYVEDDGKGVAYFMKTFIKLAEAGYKACPCGSYCFGLDFNFEELFEFFVENFKKENLVGFMTAPWRDTLDPLHEKDLDLFKAARDKYYN